MKLYASIIIVFLLMGNKVLSQENNELSSIKISDLYINTGFFIENSVPVNLSDFH